MAGYEERGVRARVAAYCAQLAGYRRSLYDRTYAIRNLYGYAASFAALQCATQDSYATLCRARCAMRL